VFAGEAGIGKTTVWLGGLEAATARGYRTLSCRPSEAETRFAFAGLADLLGAVAGDILPELPPIQRRALEAALLLGESETHADDRAVAAAFLGALRLLARDRPLCVAVDDIQWLDVASVTVLQYALARLEHAPVAALKAVRGGVPPWLVRAVPEGRLRTIEIGGLSVGALQQLLRVRLDVAFPRPTLIRLWQSSGGNPFFALELASALQRRGGTLAPGEELPIPADLDKLLAARVDGLSPAARDTARVVAALADPTVPLVEASLGRRADAGLAEALAARILELDGERLRFTHPLLGSAVAARQTPSRRRSLHAQLAKVVPTTEERARHLALATVEPNREVASILEDAALAAHARGAPATAAELAEQALRLTPSSDAPHGRRRLILAADRYAAAGDASRATALLSQARDEAAPGIDRATVLAGLASVQVNPLDTIALYEAALAEPGGDDALEATIQLDLARVVRVSAGIRRGIEHAELAVSAAVRAGDPALRCRAIARYGWLHFHGGRGIPSVQMEEALALERSLPEWPLEGGPARTFAGQLWWSGEVDRARTIFHEVLDMATARNDFAAQADTLRYMTFNEWRAGNWEESDRHGARSLDLWTQLGRLNPVQELPPTIIAAHRGRIDDARARAQRAVARSEVESWGVAHSGHNWVLGFIELSLGDSAGALPYLRRCYEARHTFMLDPGARYELGDLLETLIATGHLDEAAGILATWEPRAGALERAWALAILARGRALLLAARGDFEGAFACFERALCEHARSMDPFHQARTLLALGRTQRRAKQRGAARVTLDAALNVFDRIGAPLWVEQARAELARIGGRAPSHDELTESERRVARLVADGSTNREVAAALFLTEHSVEAMLTRIYRKLDVRSRVELAGLLVAKR
jgi:DNA-binding CsgD family transcriptional regulator